MPVAAPPAHSPPKLAAVAAAVGAKLTNRPAPPVRSRDVFPARISVAQFRKMEEAGVFDGGPRVELLDGFLRELPVPNPIHSATVSIAGENLREILPAGWHVRYQDSVTLATSEPLPDLAVLRGRPVDYLTRHPGPADVAVLIEVAESSLSTDRNTKARIYAAAGLTPYWIVNLSARRVEVHDEPHPGGGPSSGDDPPRYRRRDFGPGEAVTFHCGDATVTVPVDALLPPATEPASAGG